MTDTTENTNQTNDKPSEELVELFQRAAALGMKPSTDYSPNTKDPAKLRAKIDAFEADLRKQFMDNMEKEVAEAREAALTKASSVLPDNLPVTPPPNETPRQREKRERQEANRLIRITVVNNNPDKQEWQGEILTFRNSIVGTVRKYVPFGLNEPFHVPKVLVNILKERTFTKHVSKRDHLNRPIKKRVQLPEFNVVEHPPLTEEEWKDLRRNSKMAKGDDSE